MISMVNH